MKATFLVTLLGLLYAAGSLPGALQPRLFSEWLRKFPRSGLWGNLLMPAGTLWFLWLLNQDTVSDFAAIKPLLLAGFAIVGFGACFFVRDFLAVRGLAVVSLLVAHSVLNAIRWLDTEWRLAVTVWMYLIVVGAVWITISPWRLRDYIAWWTKEEKRLRLGCAIRVGFGLFVAVLGMTAIRAAELANRALP